MSESVNLIDKLKFELASLGPLEEERRFALITNDGEILYSDLPSEIMQKILRFKPSFPGLTIGSNITLTSKPRSTIIMCTSEKTLMAVHTKLNVGFVLAKLATISKTYAAELEQYVNSVQENKKRKTNSGINKKPQKKKAKQAKAGLQESLL